MARRGAVGLVALAVALALTAVEASAEVTTQGGFKYVEEERLIGPGTTKTFAAECPGRTHVLGGGAASGGGFGETFLSSSYPYDGSDGDSSPDDGWKAKMSSFDHFREFFAYAICARLTPTYRERRYEIPAMSSATYETVPCGQGRAILHGGFRGPTSVRPGSSFPVDGGVGGGDYWGLRVENVSDEDRFITGYAVCSDQLAVTYVSSTHALPAGDQVFGVSSCPGGAPNVVGGGQVNSSGFGNFHLNSDYPAPDPSPDQRIIGADSKFSDTSFTIWADCVADL